MAFHRKPYNHCPLFVVCIHTHMRARAHSTDYSVYMCVCAVACWIKWLIRLARKIIMLTQYVLCILSSAYILKRLQALIILFSPSHSRSLICRMTLKYFSEYHTFRRVASISMNGIKEFWYQQRIDFKPKCSVYGEVAVCVRWEKRSCESKTEMKCVKLHAFSSQSFYVNAYRQK